MFDLCSIVYSLAQVPPNCTLENLHHEGEQGPRQGGIPSALRGLIADEGVLRLYLQEL